MSNRLPLGAYVVLAETRAPIIALLSAEQCAIYAERERLADRERALVATFGHGTVAALPAHDSACMAMIAEQYHGPWETETRGLCAALALGLPTNDMPDLTELRDGDGPSGGAKVRATVPAPKAPSGGGMTFAELMTG